MKTMFGRGAARLGAARDGASAAAASAPADPASKFRRVIDRSSTTTSVTTAPRAQSVRQAEPAPSRVVGSGEAAMPDRRRFCQLLAAGALAGFARGAATRAAEPSEASPVASPEPGPARGELWVQDNNMGHAGGVSPDFKASFTTGRDAWAEARRFIRVYQLRA